MDTTKLKKSSSFARRILREQVSNRLNQVLLKDSIARRERPDSVRALERALNSTEKDQVIERAAYVWFNRFCALRFMDINRFNRIGVISPAEGQFQPEILAEAKMGYVDDELGDLSYRNKVVDVLNSKIPSSDPQTEAYRLLLIATCNKLHQAMPYLFERINDYTELLMPEDLLSGNSILAYIREALTPDTCMKIKEDGSEEPIVETIGWLYQFYISEKKDEVFDGLKKNKKITPENIPAATQLFTPHWIVRYLVENSLGRLWMLNRPNSKLIEQMEYYIKPKEAETEFLKISSPEEIKICDPACGSGHMLTYAFDLLYAIYEESGYEFNEIPEKILTHNLFGIEIDERAGELAAFALTMKARAKYRRFFRKPVQPNICVLENISLSEETLKNYTRVFGKELFSEAVIETLQQFREAKNFGSLIIPKTSKAKKTLDALQKLMQRSLVGIGGQGELPAEQRALIGTDTFVSIFKAVRQAIFLSPTYHVVIANPPYMGNKSMNQVLAKWVKDNYNRSKTDLSAVFIERNLDLVIDQGFVSMITMQSWMFLSFLESIRLEIINNNTIVSMAHLGARAFDTIGGEVVSTTAFILKRYRLPNYKGSYLRLVFERSEMDKDKAILKAAKDFNCDWLFYVSSTDFKKIPSSPIAYWIGNKIRNVFKEGVLIKELAPVKQGLATSNNERFLRYWSEVSYSKINRDANELEDTIGFKFKWYPHNKGGEFKKWYGNQDYIVNWQNNGQELWEYTSKLNQGSNVRLKSRDYYFKSGASWSDVVTTSISARYIPEGFIFDTTGPTIFDDEKYGVLFYLGLLNSKITGLLVSLLNPTLHFTLKDANRFPLPREIDSNTIKKNSDRLIEIAKNDYLQYELSWDFKFNPLVRKNIINYGESSVFLENNLLSSVYASIQKNSHSLIINMQRLEEQNNNIFNEAYGLQNELTPDVPLNEITLTCNPYYRYSGNKTEEELEALLLADTMKEFISYAVGCMFGRYALEKPGLILANQGETLEDYLNQIPDPSFPADKDNVIPILDGDWFTDDITERFRKFLRLTFGDEHYEENLKFIEDAIGKDLRKYFLKDFYSDHVKRYKKRPIYWLFSSPKGSFNALIYMHRYQPDTVSIVLNDYLREFKTKLSSRLDHWKRMEANVDASKAEKAKALKEIESLRKTIEELDTWEREIMYPLATEKIKIDLDDGVKHNYPLFGTALKKIPGLAAKESD